jgi:hypothetical protein
VLGVFACTFASHPATTTNATAAAAISSVSGRVRIIPLWRPAGVPENEHIWGGRTAICTGRHAEVRLE